jgi:thiol-disulfide isomerase/thioredoxin
MVLTPSTMLPLGHPLPAFRLPVVSGALTQRSPGTTSLIPELGRDDLPNQPVLVMLICSHCPFVKHVEPELSRLERDYGQRVSLLAVSSNSVITHPQDGPEGLRQQAQRLGWAFPYLFDEQQSLAMALRGACTPEFYLFATDSSAQQTLRYRGQLDGSRPGSAVELDGRDLRHAMDAVLAGQPLEDQQQPSIGCNIKWHPGQEPPWFGGPA